MRTCPHCKLQFADPYPVDEEGAFCPDCTRSVYLPDWRRVRWRVFWMVAIPATYVLSLGPAAVVSDLPGVPSAVSHTIGWFYLPLEVIALACPQFNDAMDWYMSWYIR